MSLGTDTQNIKLEAAAFDLCGPMWSPLIMWDYYALGRCLILHFYAAVGFLVYSSVNILCRANNFFQDALTLWLYSMCHKYSSVFLNHQLCVSFP